MEAPSPRSWWIASRRVCSKVQKVRKGTGPFYARAALLALVRFSHPTSRRGTSGRSVAGTAEGCGALHCRRTWKFAREKTRVALLACPAVPQWRGGCRRHKKSGQRQVGSGWRLRAAKPQAKPAGASFRFAPAT
ncbi:MAG: hypothetical protein ABIL62_17930 [Planctomycetota bacterium]